MCGATEGDGGGLSTVHPPHRELQKKYTNIMCETKDNETDRSNTDKKEGKRKLTWPGNCFTHEDSCGVFKKKKSA